MMARKSGLVSKLQDRVMELEDALRKRPAVIPGEEGLPSKTLLMESSKAYGEQVTKLEKMVEKIWVQKTVIGLHYLQVMVKEGSDRGSVGRAIEAILEDLPVTLLPGSGFRRLW
jgi:hypothetical protein